MVKYLRAVGFGFGSATPIASLVFCLTVVLFVSQAAANEVVQWNETTMKAIAANGQNNLVSTRTLAMVQAAVHDALNAINGRYDAYYFEGPADAAASPDAATAAAAHTVLVGVVGSFGTPAQRVGLISGSEIALDRIELPIRVTYRIIQRDQELRRRSHRAPVSRGPVSGAVASLQGGSLAQARPTRCRCSVNGLGFPAGQSAGGAEGRP